jgi:DNA-binding transcriptional regulator YhcF (GntR family)
MSQEPVDARYLYEQIYSELKEEILSGTYKKGDWFPPERVLKDRFNTTHLTVRNALAKLVLEGYIERYSGKGTLVIYSRARSSARQKALSFPLAHVILENLDEANAALLELLEAQLRKVPLAVRVSCHHGDVLLAQGIHREAQESGALVILEPPVSMGSSVRNTILVRGRITDASCPRVDIDDAEGARMAVRAVADLGYRKIALLSTIGSAPHDGLLEGFLDETAVRGMTAGEGVLESCAPGVDGGARAVRAILARDADCRAFLCGSDETAAGAVSGLKAAGLIAGADCAVVGYGNTRLARATGLASIDPGFNRLAERVMASAREAMGRGTFTDEAFHVTPELVVRATCGRSAFVDRGPVTDDTPGGGTA